MESPTSELPAPKRARLDPARHGDLFASLPDEVIYRVFDFLTMPFRYHLQDEYTNDPGASNEFREALSWTCRRLYRCYLEGYVTVFPWQVDFQMAGNLLEYFPSLHTLRQSTLDRRTFEAPNHLFCRIIDVDLLVKGTGVNLCVISRACPSLKILRVRIHNTNKGIQIRVDGDFSLPSLEKLSLGRYVAVTVEDWVNLLTGVESLLNLNFSGFFRNISSSSVSRALPQTLERIRLDNFVFGSDDQLNILANLPRLKDLEILFNRRASWSKLLPTTASLEIFKMVLRDEELDDELSEVIASMESLKRLDLDIPHGGSWDGVLRAISTLKLLEDLTLTWGCSAGDPSERGLLYLANGPVRRSLAKCEIKVGLLIRNGINGQLGESLTRCFEQEVKASFEKRDGGAWKFTVCDVTDI
mmetsp:Transcript_29/g.99  ORF Transcript_29/g.99 Transcript_29/m.99 type:complete len:414 (-) Transcript_29:573-1814(-)